MENWEYLKKIPVFSGLLPEELQRIADLAIIRHYRKNMYIFLEGEPGNAFYFLKKGLVKMFQVLEDGREKILHFVNEGEFFAEVLLFEGGVYPATAQTMVDCEVGSIHNEDMEKLLQSHGEMAVKIIKVMSRRLRQAQGQVRDLALKSAYGRLASALIQLAEEYGIREKGGTIITLNLSQQEIANLIGTSRETVARILSDFRRLGALEVQRQRITILDHSKLEGWI